MATGKFKLLQSADRLLGPWFCRRIKPAAVQLKPTDHAAGRQLYSKPVAAQQVQRLLVIRPGGLGDAALTYPMLRALRQGYPEARIDVLVEKRNAGIYAITDIVSNVYRYDSNALSVLRCLRNLCYDMVIDTEQFHHFSTIFANFLRPKYLCGFDTLGRRRFQTHSVTYDVDTYEGRSFLALAAAVLGQVDDFDPEQAFIDVGSKAQAWAHNNLEVAGERQLVVVAPAASGASRLWPVARYAEVVGWLISRKYFVVLLGGRDGIEAARSIEDQSSPEAVLNLVGKTTLVQSAAVLQQADLSISADTGVMHLAYGVGTPTISLFGSGLPLKWAPPGRHHRIVRKELPCSPGIRFGRLPPCPHEIACMRELCSKDVIAAVEKLMDER